MLLLPLMTFVFFSRMHWAALKGTLEKSPSPRNL